jgi:phage terminase large subunit-like protein
VLKWTNGAEAHAFSAEDPESLRGPQFSAAWADEFCIWPQPAETLATLRLGLRVGDDPRLAVTTTPRPLPALRALLSEPGCRLTGAATRDNPHLAPAFLDSVEAVYGGTRFAAQELEGALLEAEGALWRREELDRCRGAKPDRFDRVLVGVDPPASATGDACGIVVAGRRADRAYVLADLTAQGLSPNGWATAVVAAAAAWGASVIVAEANQGGDMVRAVLAAAAPGGPSGARIQLVHASRAKRARAEPVAALYEQGRVTHCGDFPALEEELMTLGAEGAGSRAASPDRADALVWALTALMLEREAGEPRIRVL